MANATNSDKTGVSCYDGAGTFNGRTITAGTGISVADGDGVSGDPTISADAVVATTYTADSGSATPAANNLNVFGGTGIDTSGASDTLTINASDAVPLTFTADTGSATPAGNNLNIVGSGGITTSGSGSTVTITGQGSIDPEFLFSNLLEWDDFISGSVTDNNNTKLGWYVNGSVEFSKADSAHPGIAQLGADSGTQNLISTERGDPSLYPLIVGGGVLTLDWVMKLDSLSTGGSSYTMRMGFFNDPSGPSFTITDGIWFEYNHAVNSGNWQMKTRSSSTTTTANSSTAATTDWTHFRIQVNAAGTQVAYYIDGVELTNSPIATNIPSAGLGIAAWQNRTSGSASVSVDLMIVHYELTTSRA